MTCLTPTAAELKVRHPQFAGLNNEYVDAIIAEAARYVDSTWFEADQKPAIMHLAAHMMLAEDALASTSVPGVGVLTSVKLGDASEAYASGSVGVSGSDFSTSSHGRAFLRLQRVNIPAVLIV